MNRMEMYIKMVAMTITLICGLLLISSITVTGCERVREREFSQYCMEQGKVAQRQVREYLEDHGFRNAGVMVTYVMNEACCNFQIAVHHDKVQLLSSEEAQNLQLQISNAAGMEKAGFCMDASCIVLIP